MKEFILQVINGLQVGSIYALVSLGYTMVYGAAKLINFAHGDIIMIGAYTSLMSIPFFVNSGLPVWLSVIPAIVVCTLIGLLTERVAYRPLRNSPKISNLITAIGVSLLFQNVALMKFGSASRSVPKIFNAPPIEVFGLKLNYTMVITICTTVVLTIVLQLFMKNTKFGKGLIATSQDYDAAKLVGINVDNAIASIFGIGSMLGAVGALFYIAAYPQVNPYIGAMLGIKAFIAAVVGGIGITHGAVVGGFILGIVEAMTKAYISTELADVFVFLILIVVLLVKPAGIFGKNVKEKV
ncbi:MAG: branched-chain amino acid ABC transporter permease [Tissierellia bacterium]|nr:branched-chain amino acid ABC transporter permease [Tissierellia bacterium]